MLSLGPLQHTGRPNPTLGAIFPTVAACALMFSTTVQSPPTSACLVVGGLMISAWFQLKKHLQRTNGHESITRLKAWSFVE